MNPRGTIGGGYTCMRKGGTLILDITSTCMYCKLGSNILSICKYNQYIGINTFITIMSCILYL